MLLPALLPVPAQAQSTATRIEEGLLHELEAITVTAPYSSSAAPVHPGGAPRSRARVGHDFLSTQMAGQSVMQSLNLVPGVNFTSVDAYGGGGGNLRMRGFDGSRISLMVDGIQLNDSGNYAIYTGQLPDPEVIEFAAVSAGSTDVDSPTASATGGTINLVTARPRSAAAFMLRPSLGSDRYRRLFLRADSGAFGPWGTTAYVTWSQQQYDKFKGPGQLRRQQLNARLFQDLGGGDFISVFAHYNRGRNHFYRSAPRSLLQTQGLDFDFDADCRRLPPVAGVAQDEGDPSVSCSNYYNARFNPSDTGNLRMQSGLRIAPGLRLTFDPSLQWVLANGGGYRAIAEDDMRLRGDPAIAGVDLNGDGDLLDHVALHAPNNTRTLRHGLNSALLWDVAPGKLLRLSYTFDRARHRQTGEIGLLDSDGDPQHVFAGLDGARVQTADGATLRRRDRKSIALLHQVSLSFSGSYRNGQLKLNLGLRAPFFRRELNQYCHTPVAHPGGDPWCTTQAQVGQPDAQGGVRLAGSGDSRFVPPFSGTQKNHRVLPNLGILLRPWDDANQIFYSYAQGFSAPRTDNLYGRQLVQVQPEISRTHELGYRHLGPAVLGSVTLWKTRFSNRIVSAWDEMQAMATDRNVGTVKLWGVDAALGAEPLPGLSVYGTASFNHSRMQRDVQMDATRIAPTAGRSLVDTPHLTLGARLQYRTAGFRFGLQARHVGRRWANDINTESTGSHAVADLDLAHEMQLRSGTSSVQLNVLNLFDRRYAGAISTSIDGAGSYSAGAPRTLQLSWTLAVEGGH